MRLRVRARRLLRVGGARGLDRGACDSERGSWAGAVSYWQGQGLEWLELAAASGARAWHAAAAGARGLSESVLGAGERARGLGTATLTGARGCELAGDGEMAKRRMRGAGTGALAAAAETAGAR